MHLPVWLALTVLSASVLASPMCAGRNCPSPDNSRRRHWQKRVSLELIVTETQMAVFSATQTQTVTETFTTTESPNTLPISFTEPEINLVGVAPLVSDAQSVLFLPFTTPSTPTLTPSSETLSSSFPESTDSAISTIDSAIGTAVASETPAVVSSTTATAQLSDTTTSTSLESVTTTEDATETPSATDDPSATPSVAPADALHTPSVKGPLVSAYYPDWASSDLPPEDINMAVLDWIDFAFVTPNSNFGLSWDDPATSPDVLNRVVSAAHAGGTKVKISIGGWSGSKYFSSACATVGSRKTFVNNVVAFYKQYKLDGVDIDWEYPGQAGIGSNVVSPQDSQNFLAMLKLLRTSLPSSARITAAVQDVPFADANGNPMKDVSAFATVLDWVNIMNYDVFGSSANPGANAPLTDACHNSTQPTSNAAAAMQAWSSAKFPVGRLMLGVPAYGYVNPSHAKSITHKRSEPQRSGIQRQRRQVLQQASAAFAKVKSEDGSTNGGQVQFSDLIGQGALVPADTGGGPPGYVGSSGFTRYWDSCSSTPFLSSPYANQVITYDDPQSLGAKAKFVVQSKMLGTAMWDLSGDTSQSDLTKALRQGLGKR